MFILLDRTLKLYNDVSYEFFINVISFYKITKIVREKLLNHLPSARDLEAFLVFSQHPAWVITPVNP